MATGNLFLGTARRKVGDVVLYRRNGVQQSRVRVRTIANPKTLGQALQRNYLAPVARFYAPLAAVLETSFEGLTKSKSTAAFNKRNLELAREQGFYVPKGASWLPLPYQLSNGTIAAVEYGAEDQDLVVYGVGTGYTGSSTIGNLSTAMIAAGYLAGDQVTFIFALQGMDGLHRPAWCRIVLDAASSVSIQSVLPQGVSVDPTVTNALALMGVDESISAGAVIVSRYAGGMWRRSKQYMSVDPDILSEYTSEDAYAAAMASYRGGSSVVSSDVYLNGSDTDGGDVITAITSYIRAISGTMTEDQMIAGMSSYQIKDMLVRIGGSAANDGSLLLGNVINAITDHPDYGEVLTFDSTWTPITGTPLEISPARVFKVTSADDPVALWLIEHGIDRAIF